MHLTVFLDSTLATLRFVSMILGLSDFASSLRNAEPMTSPQRCLSNRICRSLTLSASIESGVAE